MLVHNTNFMPTRSADTMPTAGAGGGAGRVDMGKVIYDNLKRRMQSRYGNRGRIFLPSSKARTDSFTAERIQEAKNDPRIFVRDYSLWDVKPDDFSAQKFWVLCGNEQVPSQILKDDDVEAVKRDLPERTVLIEVPEDLRKSFESDLEGSIRDLAGVSTVAISPFIAQVEKIRQMANPDRQHPFSVETLDPSQGGGFAQGLMIEETRRRLYDGSYEAIQIPRINPDAPRHVHFDLALNECSAGMCMAHVSGTKAVERHSPQLGYYETRERHYTIDFVLEIAPPPGGEIDFALFEHLTQKLMEIGYPIHKVTADQWQSVQLLQRFEKKGLRTEQISMDTTMGPYKCAKQAIYEHRVDCYYYRPLFRELSKLEADWEKRKVKKPRTGSKDVADAFAGVLYSLSQARIYDPLPMTKGHSWHESDEDDFEQRVMGGLVPVDADTPLPRRDDTEDDDELPPILLG